MDEECCANCGCFIGERMADGLSSVYSPDRAFRLCEPCWLEEDAEIERQGTNDLPHLRERYEANVANNFGFD